MECDLELCALPCVDPVALFCNPIIKYCIAYSILKTLTWNKLGIEIYPFFPYRISKGINVLLNKSNIFSL